MPTSIRVATCAALLVASAALPGLAQRSAAASCSGWNSELLPPPTIRVFRHVSGAVDTVDFAAYTRNVLSREWIGSWTTESLRSGALAVKTYAWYQVLHWRGGVNEQGECFDIRDDTLDQVYDPTRATWSTAAAAVDATWTWRVLRNGAIFPTYYNAGSVNEACAANANGWKLWQWGTQACGLAGWSATQILLAYYYPGVSVETDAPAATPTATPTASPTLAPSPSATPSASATPSTPSSASPTPAATPSSTPLPSPSPTPASTPLPTPPQAGGSPGGGQAGLTEASSPPPPPPSDPEPVVAEPASEGGVSGERPVWERGAQAMRRVLEWDDRVRSSALILGHVYVGAVWREPAAAALEAALQAPPRPASRWLTAALAGEPTGGAALLFRTGR